MEILLKEPQIQYHMSIPPDHNQSGLVGFWDFNEGTGSTLLDKTSNDTPASIKSSGSVFIFDAGLDKYCFF